MAAIADFYMAQGSSFIEAVDMTGDYTGYTISISISDSTGTSVANTATWTDIANGKFKLEVDETITANVATGVAKYNVKIDNGTNVFRLLQGRIYVDGDVG